MRINPANIISGEPLSLADGPPVSESPSGAGTFRTMLAEAAAKQKQADKQVQSTLLGEADIHDAMLALEHADLSLRLLVQVRNKLVQAYEELTRMPM